MPWPFEKPILLSFSVCSSMMNCDFEKGVKINMPFSRCKKVTARLRGLSCWGVTWSTETVQLFHGMDWVSISSGLTSILLRLYIFMTWFPEVLRHWPPPTTGGQARFQPKTFSSAVQTSTGWDKGITPSVCSISRLLSSSGHRTHRTHALLVTLLGAAAFLKIRPFFLKLCTFWCAGILCTRVMI